MNTERFALFALAALVVWLLLRAPAAQHVVLTIKFQPAERAVHAINTGGM